MRLDLADPSAALRRFAPRVGAFAATWPARHAAAWTATVRWWRDCAPRERWLLIALAAVAVTVAVERLAWQPLIAARRAAQAEIARDDRIAAQLRVAGPEVARIAAARRGTLASVVTDGAARAGLPIARLEPQGSNVAVALDGVGFDALVDWLAALDHDAGVAVVALQVDRRPDPGRVTAQVTLTER